MRITESTSTRREDLIDPSNEAVSIRRQCELLHVPRSSYYYRPKGPDGEADGAREAAMREVDEIHLEFPCYGARKIAKELARRGLPGWKRHAVEGLMREMGIVPVYPKPSLSSPSKRSKRFPYLLKNKAVRFANQVWSSDITYVSIGGTHMYVYAIIDWYSRYIVGWDLLPDMGAGGVCRTMERAFEQHGTPGICNSDQGSVFGSERYVKLLEGRHVPQSMDGRARWVDNVLMERWFRTLKSECLRINEYETPAQLRSLIADFVERYNNGRIHESLGYETPAEWYLVNGWPEALPEAA